MVALMAGWTLQSLLRTEENWAGSPELPASIDGSVEAVDSCSDYSETPKETDGWSGSLVSPAATNDLHSSPEPPAGTEAGPVPARPLVEVELAGTVQTICSVQAATAKKTSLELPAENGGGWVGSPALSAETGSLHGWLSSQVKQAVQTLLPPGVQNQLSLAALPLGKR